MSIILYVVAFAIGFVVARIGMWWRLHQIEGTLRNLSNTVHEEALLDKTDQVLAAWVVNRIDTIVNKEFR